MSSHDFRHPNFNLLTDANLLRYIASVRDGVLIGTRPSINLAVAHLDGAVGGARSGRTT